MHRPTRPRPGAATGFNEVREIPSPVNIANILDDRGRGVNNALWPPSLGAQLPFHQVADDVVGHLVKLLDLVGHFGRGFEGYVAKRGKLAA